VKVVKKKESGTLRTEAAQSRLLVNEMNLPAQEGEKGLTPSQDLPAEKGLGAGVRVDRNSKKSGG